MKSESREKEFDCVKWTREVRDRINDQIADMSGEELREWLSQRPTEPVLARLFDRRKAPEGGGVRAQATGGRGGALHR